VVRRVSEKTVASMLAAPDMTPPLGKAVTGTVN
jgi:hypothetical protein